MIFINNDEARVLHHAGRCVWIAGSGNSSGIRLTGDNIEAGAEGVGLERKGAISAFAHGLFWSALWRADAYYTTWLNNKENQCAL